MGYGAGESFIRFLVFLCLHCPCPWAIVCHVVSVICHTAGPAPAPAPLGGRPLIKNLRVLLAPLAGVLGSCPPSTKGQGICWPDERETLRLRRIAPRRIIRVHGGPLAPLQGRGAAPLKAASRADTQGASNARGQFPIAPHCRKACPPHAPAGFGLFNIRANYPRINVKQ